MIDALGVCVYVPLYPLAPRERCDRALDNLLCYYRRVLQSYAGADVTFAGDSAGGSLCLSLAMLARNRAQPLPARLVLLSPCCSLCATEKQLAVMREIEKRDVMLSTKMIDTIPRLIAQDFDPRHYLASPLYGNFSGLPPVHIFSGTADILFVQALLLVERLKKHRAPYTFRVARDRMHVWVRLPREGREAARAPPCRRRRPGRTGAKRRSRFGRKAKAVNGVLARLQRSEPRCFCRFGVRSEVRGAGGEVSWRLVLCTCRLPRKGRDKTNRIPFCKKRIGRALPSASARVDSAQGRGGLYADAQALTGQRL